MNTQPSRYRTLLFLATLSAAVSACSDDTTGPAPGPDRVARASEFEIVASNPFTERITTDLWAFGNYVYTGTLGLPTGCTNPADDGCGNFVVVWSISDPTAPRQTASVTLPARRVNDVKVSADGSFAVATLEGAGDRNGIVTLDLANPGEPEIVTFYGQGLANGVHNVWIERIRGVDYVFVVADGETADAGLHVLDVSNRAAPREVAQFYGGTSVLHDVYVRDGLAFLSHWDAGLIILDVGSGIRGGSPANPVEVSRVTTPNGNVHSAWYWPERGVVFVGEENFPPAPIGEVQVVDVTDLARPSLIASYSVAGVTPHNFWVDEEDAALYVGWYEAGVLALDVSGELRGEMEAQQREIASLRPGSAGGETRIWAPQLHRGLVSASDMSNGLWTLRLTGTGE